LNHSNSSITLTGKSVRDLAKISPRYILNDNYPELIDEWSIVPTVWDAVRNKCDEDKVKGKFILTGSTTVQKEEVFHSGTGRIDTITMYPMSLYESKDSTGDVSIMDMYNDTVKEKGVPIVELPTIANLICRGGWPENIFNEDIEDVTILPKSYINSVIKKDIHERKDKRRDSARMLMLLKSLARNESIVIGDDTLIKDIATYENNEEKIESRKTISDYIGVLDDIYITTYQNAFDTNYRSSKRVGKSPKRHLVDPSLSCACLNLNVEKLMKDLNTFGFLFEALVERDLRIYMEYLGGSLYHFRDNTSGDEVDAILEFDTGEYAAVEIKLSSNGIESAKKSLTEFYNNVEKKPKFMCIIIGYYGAIMKDKETGIYIVPITSLRP